MGFGIQDLFNPMALISDLGQGLQGLMNPSAQSNQAGATQTGNSLMDMLGGTQSTASSYASTGSSAAPTSTPCAATTEFPANQACPQGYSNTSQAATAAGGAPVQPVDPQLMSTMESVCGNFAQFDAQYAASAFRDGQFDMNNVQNIAQHPNDFQPSVVAAANYLNSNPQVFDQMAMLSGGNGEVTAAGAQAYMQHLVAQQGAYNQQQAAASSATSAASATAAPASQLNPYQPPFQTETAQLPTATQTGAAGSSSGSAGGLTGLQSEVEQYGQTEEANLQAQLDAAMKSGQSPQQIQDLANSLQQMTEIFSNIDKMFQDMAMNTISNTR